MRKLSLILLLATSRLFAQDINCDVQVRTDNIQATNKEIFTELELAIEQFINQRKWISDKILPHEKINCNMVLNISSFNIDQFKANVTISSSRPVYGTSYNTPMFSFFDQNWTFQYAQFQSLDFQDNANVNALTSLLAFYTYIIIGMDFDSFYPEGGTQYYNKALAIRNAAQNTPGWNPSDGSGNRNRYYIIDNLTDSRFKPVHAALYQFHRQGMDEFKDEPEAARREIYASLEKIRTIQQDLPNSVIFKIFFNAKRQELVSIFQKAEPGMKNRASELLGLMDPSNKAKYEAIKRN